MSNKVWISKYQFKFEQKGKICMLTHYIAVLPEVVLSYGWAKILQHYLETVEFTQSAAAIFIWVDNSKRTSFCWHQEYLACYPFWDEIYGIIALPTRDHFCCSSDIVYIVRLLGRFRIEDAILLQHHLTWAWSQGGWWSQQGSGLN